MAIVGAGVAGLVSAIVLAARGLDVTILERGPRPGGKLREVELDGRSLDAGPTVFTMRWVLDEIFATVGASLDDHLTLTPARVLARHAWNGDQRLDLYADVARSAEAIGDFAGAEEARRYLAFSDRARRIYETLERPFLRSARPTPLSLVRDSGLRGLGELWRIEPFATLWGTLGDYFHDPRLRQLFGRYATYCGSSPFQAPATLMLIAHVERDGVWMVEGGMYGIARALAKLAAGLGAKLRCDAEVAEVLVTGGRVSGVKLSSGEEVPADAVVVNADAAAVALGRLGAAIARAVPTPARSMRSLSAITWSLVAETRGFPLLRHNVFFSADYEAEFADLFRESRVPAAPTVYVCAQDRTDGDIPNPAGAERLLCLVNAPATGDVHPFPLAEIEQCAQKTFGLLENCGLRIERSAPRCRVTTPADFERLFPATGGALYGQAAHGWQASFRRPGSRSRVPGLYLAGGSTHPGPGVPMAALSGRLAAASVIADLASTSRSRRAATPGGTSTG